MFLLLAGFAVILSAIFVLERYVQPKTPKKTLLQHITFLAIAPIAMFYLTLFMLSYRPIFSVVFTLVFYLGIIVANNAKFRVLKEPLVYSDFSLLREAFKHPELYVGYIGPFKISVVFLLGGSALVGGALYEPAVIERISFNDYLPVLIFLGLLTGLIYMITWGALRQVFQQILAKYGASTHVEDDIEKLSLIVCLVFYFLLSGANAKKVVALSRRNRNDPIFPDSSLKKRPHLIAVQSESFFDARRLLTHVPDGFLRHFDAASHEAAFSGRMKVSAWGANTLRTEFAFLSGLTDEALGMHRFNPYLSLEHRKIWNLASHLRDSGYKTVCIHPFDRSFFGRDKVFPDLGFEEFIDIKSFSADQKVGPYISDAAVTDKIEEYLKTNNRPLFLFAITMENHGRWVGDRIKRNPELRAAMPVKSNELLQYLSHLRNADTMIGRLVATLKSGRRNATFCFYGDHLPSLPHVFDSIGYKDPQTDYFIWQTKCVKGQRVDLSADQLNRMVLENLTGFSPVWEVREEP